jgi:TonB family protein
MIKTVNEFSSNWFGYFLNIVIQNSIFLIIILGILFLIPNSNVRVLRALLLLSLIKLLIPPIISVDLIQDIAPINIETLSVIPVSLFSENIVTNEAKLSTNSVFLLIWIGTILTILLITIINTYRYSIKLRGAKLIDTSIYNVNQNNSIKIFKSSFYHSPFVIGILNPKIILPKNWDNWTIDNKRTVLYHEYGHIIEKDHLINILKLIIQAVYFFNPLVWLLIKKLNQYSEMLCDDFTIDALNSNQINYSKHLLKISEMTKTLRRIGSKSLAFSESFKSIKNRINYQFKKKENNFMKELNLKSVILLLLFSAVIMPFSWQCNTTKTTRTFENAQSSRIFEFEDVSKKPKMINKVRPEYPESARKEGLEGIVVITITINETGSVENAEIFQALNDSVQFITDESGKREVKFINKSNIITSLDQSAINAATKIKFEPAELNGQPVKVKMNIPLNFRL